MDIEKYLEDNKKKVDEALKRILSSKPEAGSKLVEAIRYSVLTPGKRIRPILTLASAEACEGDFNVVLPTACAIELIHTFTLIHDDLPAIDNSDLRRGKPSCHKAFGEATAVLAGDALLTLAFDVVLKYTNLRKITPKILLNVLEEVSGAAGFYGVIGGEEMDIALEGKEANEQEIIHMYSHKTGALIQVAVRCGAMLSKAKHPMLFDLTKFSEHLGIAFQIVDDVLDLEGKKVEVGKPIGQDLKKGKATYPSIVGVTKAKERAAEEVESAIKMLERFGKNADPLRGIAHYIVDRNK